MILIKLITAFILAFLLSAFQYLYKKKSRGFFALRFSIYFILLLLILDFSIKTYTEKITKPDLFILVDQSRSIPYLKGESLTKNLLDSINSSELNKKYHLHFFGFGKNLFPIDSLHFDETGTYINQSLKSLEALYDKNYTAPVLLISDGNSTSDRMSAMDSSSLSLLNIFPVVIGDTTRFDNLLIDEINVNPIAFKGNKFPVEISINYSGKKPIQTTLTIKKEKHLLSSKKIIFNKSGTKFVKFYLPAKQIGKQVYKAHVSPFKEEKNKKDNIKHFSIEIVNQEKKIAIISSFIHPDIGLIKRQLKKNKYIKTDFFLIQDVPSNLSGYSTLILYQPTPAFSKIFKNRALYTANWFMLTGTHTDWAWINKQNLFFSKRLSHLHENYFPVENADFRLFELPDLSFENYPPLKDFYGIVNTKNSEIALYAKINHIKTNQGLLLFNRQKKQAVLLGENYWQWGVYAHKMKEDKPFDELFQQIIQYVSLNKDMNPMKLTYKLMNFEGDPIEIKAHILNRNLAPDLKDQVSLSIYDSIHQKTYETPLLLQKNYYTTTISQLSPGRYNLIVHSKNRNKTLKGKIEILPLDKEKMYLNANYNSLKNLADQTKGKVYFPNQFRELLSYLNKNNNYPSHIKSHQENLSLIDYRYLLVLLVLLLGLEWLFKKLRGDI